MIKVFEDYPDRDKILNLSLQICPVCGEKVTVGRKQKTGEYKRKFLFINSAMNIIIIIHPFCKRKIGSTFDCILNEIKETGGFYHNKLHWSRKWLENKHNEGLSAREISLICRVKTSNIQYFLKKFNITGRSFSEVKTGIKKIKKFNLEKNYDLKCLELDKKILSNSDRFLEKKMLTGLSLYRQKNNTIELSHLKNL